MIGVWIDIEDLAHATGFPRESILLAVTAGGAKVGVVASRDVFSWEIAAREILKWTGLGVE